MNDSGNSYCHISCPHLSYPILHTSCQTYLLAVKTHSCKLFIVNFPVPFVDKLITPSFSIIIAAVFWVNKQGIDSRAINNYLTQHLKTKYLNQITKISIFNEYR